MVFCLHVYLHEGVGSSGTGAIDSWELPRVNAMWVLEMEPAPLEDQPVLLTPEPPLHACIIELLNQYFSYTNDFDVNLTL
jgi:hypothetical protein